MFNVMTPDHHAAILAKFGLHGPRKQMGGLGAFGGTPPTDPHGGGGMPGQPPADPHGGMGGTPPADPHGGTATYQPMPSPVMPPAAGATLPPWINQLRAGMTAGQPPADPHGGTPGLTPGQPPADPRTGVPAAGQYAAYGQPQTNYQPLLTGGQAPTAGTGPVPPWLQSLLALMR